MCGIWVGLTLMNHAGARRCRCGSMLAPPIMLSWRPSDGAYINMAWNKSFGIF